MGERKVLKGVLTESCLDEAEAEFPGITRFYRTVAGCPLTFLELVWRYLESNERTSGVAVKAAA